MADALVIQTPKLSNDKRDSTIDSNRSFFVVDVPVCPDTLYVVVNPFAFREIKI